MLARAVDSLGVLVREEALHRPEEGTLGSRRARAAPQVRKYAFLLLLFVCAIVMVVFDMYLLFFCFLLDWWRSTARNSL